MRPSHFQATYLSKIAPGELILAEEAGTLRFGIILKPIQNSAGKSILFLGPWSNTRASPVVIRAHQEKTVLSLGSDYSIEPDITLSKITVNSRALRTYGSLSLKGFTRYLDAVHSFSEHPIVIDLDNLISVPSADFVEDYDVTFQQWSLLLDSQVVGESRSTLFTWRV